uniref:Uncharacterized protein n=1 Tax=Triticum urartu TaxID=4572 RepID=A0A8R7QQB3_TRIUA
MFSRFRGHVSWEMGCHALDLCTWTEAIKGSSHERGVRGLRAPVMQGGGFNLVYVQMVHTDYGKSAYILGSGIH